MKKQRTILSVWQARKRERERREKEFCSNGAESGLGSGEQSSSVMPFLHLFKIWFNIFEHKM